MPAGTDASTLTPEQLASIGRTIAYNDTQAGGRACGDSPCGEGDPNDRNVELLIADPRRSAGGGGDGRCANPLEGTRKRDRLRGTAGGDRLRGRAGNDRLSGKAGEDCLQGGRGSDRLRGGGGRDTLEGGGGRDRVKGGGGRDKLDGGRAPTGSIARDGGRDKVRCGPGRDRVKADRSDRVRSGPASGSSAAAGNASGDLRQRLNDPRPTGAKPSIDLWARRLRGRWSAPGCAARARPRAPRRRSRGPGSQARSSRTG